MILPPDDEEDGPLVPLPRVLRNASVRSEVNWVSRKSSRYFILTIYKCCRVDCLVCLLV